MAESRRCVKSKPRAMTCMYYGRYALFLGQGATSSLTCIPCVEIVDMRRACDDHIGQRVSHVRYGTTSQIPRGRHERWASRGPR